MALHGSRPVSPPGPVVFEPEYLEGLRKVFEELIVFNQLLGLKITSVTPDKVVTRVTMRPDLVGHFGYNRLHGGVISAVLDTTAGLAVLAAGGARHMHEPPAQRLQRFAKLGTIDLRIDYLRPGISEHFEAHAQVIRLGSRVASTRMEFLDAQGQMVATGSAVYIVS